MAITYHERVGKAMALRAGRAPVVEREVHAAVKAGSVSMDAIRRFAEDPKRWKSSQSCLLVAHRIRSSAR